MWGWLWRAKALPVMDVRGISVEVHWTVVIPLLLWSSLLASTSYLGRFADLSDTEITAMALVTVFLIPVATLLHEFGHSFQARREGTDATKITLWGLGGVAWIGDVGSPGKAFRIAAAGPLVTAVLAPILAALSWLAARAGLPDAVVGVLLLLAQFEAFVLVFNLLPVFPMDGGRILHSSLWRRRGVAFALTWTPRVAVTVASLVLVYGAVAPFIGALTPRRLWSQSGQATPGLSIMITGGILLWFALSSRSSPARRTGRRELLLGDLLEVPGPGPDPAPGMTIAQFLRETGDRWGYGTAAYRVVDDGRVVGIISQGLADQVPAELREKATVADTMTRQDDALVLDWTTSVEAAFHTLQGGSSPGIVLDGKRVTAILVAPDLADVLLRVRDSERSVEPAVAHHRD